MAERKNTGLAVPEAKRLNDCYHELTEAIAARPAMKGDRDLWQYDYAALAGGPEGAERVAWNRRCASKDIALVALRGAVTSGDLQLWTYGPQGEAKVDRFELKELNLETFASGTYQPLNRRLDSAELADSPLWVKEADWRQYMLDLWALRYGSDWSNPAPPADKPLLPPDGHFVTLSHALSWIAFGVSMDSDQLHAVLNEDRYGEHDPQEAIKDAIGRLTALGSGRKVAMRGKYRASNRDDRRTLLTGPIPPEKLDDFRLFNELYDALEHGEGMFHWRTPQGLLSRNGHGGRSDSFVDVTVDRVDLLREFPPKARPNSEAQRFRVGHAFTRDDPATIAPWWSVNQALAWVATRIPSYVEYIGDLEKQEPLEYRPWFVQAICESQVAESDECKALMDSRRASWPAGSFLAHAGRALLEKILTGQVAPMTRDNGQGREMRRQEFVGIGAKETGGDWLDPDPQPLFSSAEIMRAFPASELELGGGGGIIPQATPNRNRKRPGPAPDPDWPDAIATVAQECISAGYKRPLKRGDKAAIQTMLLNYMTARNKNFSEDIARKHAESVIAALPDN